MELLSNTIVVDSPRVPLDAIIDRMIRFLALAALLHLPQSNLNYNKFVKRRAMTLFLFCKWLAWWGIFC